MKKIYLTIHQDFVVEDEATKELEEILISNVSLWPTYIKIEGRFIRLSEIKAILPYEKNKGITKKKRARKQV